MMPESTGNASHRSVISMLESPKNASPRGVNKIGVSTKDVSTRHRSVLAALNTAARHSSMKSIPVSVGGARYHSVVTISVRTGMKVLDTARSQSR